MENVVRVSRRVLEDSAQPFDVTVLEPAETRVALLFSVGAGGDPNRHLPLLQSLAANGCTIVAPHFDRMTVMAPGGEDLAMRARRLQFAFAQIAPADIPAAGVGHSIGAAMLLVLSGAEASTLGGETIRVSMERRLERLALMAPAMDFFRRPGALAGVRASIAAWAATRDEITPPAQAEFLKKAVQGAPPVDLRLVAGAGHFSFMNTPPPHAVEPLADRDKFLDRLASEVASFIVG